MTSSSAVLARAIRTLAERLPRLGARVADINELDELASAFVQFATLPPAPLTGNKAIAHWEDAIALLLRMAESARILVLRSRDPVVLDKVLDITLELERLLDEARLMRRAVAQDKPSLRKENR